MKTDSVKCLTPEVKWYERNLPPSVIKYKISDDKLMKSLMEIVDNDGDGVSDVVVYGDDDDEDAGNELMFSA